MLSFCLRALVILLAVLASGRAAGPPSFDYFEFRPAALSANSPAQVLFAVRVNGDPSQVSLVPTGLGLTTPVALRDDGQGGDETAGDRIYSLLASTAPILDVRRADDVNRVFVGFLDLYDGVARVARANIFVDVYTPDVGEFELTTLSASVQATATLVNIQADLLTSDLPSITREFYRWFPDDYDFLNIVYMPGRFRNRAHFTVRTDVDGIGVPRVDNTAHYGSAGRLLGITESPIASFFDAAESGHHHELAHQWINYLDFAPLAQGIPHWPYSSMAGGVMGESIGGRGGQGESVIVLDVSGAISGSMVLPVVGDVLVRAGARRHLYTGRTLGERERVLHLLQRGHAYVSCRVLRAAADAARRQRDRKRQRRSRVVVTPIQRPGADGIPAERRRRLYWHAADDGSRADRRGSGGDLHVERQRREPVWGERGDSDADRGGAVVPETERTHL